ncbi:MAG: 2-C-methyl-D-erythritol 4-phosphate cytidylyltransferase [Victivallales bacterium]|nr:2-C-methyl-D-erythritol 4-phosphate cytidylyltransferase [Victivallales bacterium]
MTDPHKRVDDLGIVVVAAGCGTRFNGAVSKLLMPIDGVPVFVHALRNFSGLCAPGNLVLVVRQAVAEDFRRLADQHLPETKITFTNGGDTRMQSVFNGISTLSKSAIEFVAVHDAARPFATRELLLQALQAAREHGSAVVAKRITDTVKRASPDNLVLQTLDRSGLWTVETPQIFRLDELLDAYRKARVDGFEAGDDAGIMEHSGLQPKLIEHRLDNRKITFAEDLP